MDYELAQINLAVSLLNLGDQMTAIRVAINCAVGSNELKCGSLL